jgi:hypothetical protein
MTSEYMTRIIKGNAAIKAERAIFVVEHNSKRIAPLQFVLLRIRNFRHILDSSLISSVVNSPFHTENT